MLAGIGHSLNHKISALAFAGIFGFMPLNVYSDVVNAGGGSGNAGSTSVIASVGEPAIGLGPAGSTTAGTGFIYTLGSGPPVVTGLTASDGTFTDRIRLNWNAAAGATDYLIFRTLPADNNPQQIDSTSATTFDDLTVTDTQVYR